MLVMHFAMKYLIQKNKNETDILKKKKKNRNRFKPTGFGSVF